MLRSATALRCTPFCWFVLFSVTLRDLARIYDKNSIPQSYRSPARSVDKPNRRRSDLCAKMWTDGDRHLYYFSRRVASTSAVSRDRRIRSRRLCDRTSHPDRLRQHAARARPRNVVYLDAVRRVRCSEPSAPSARWRSVEPTLLRPSVSSCSTASVFERAFGVPGISALHGNRRYTLHAIGTSVSQPQVQPNFLDERLPPRFWSKVVPEPNSGCWLWCGALTTAGYGLISWPPTHTNPPTYTHRLTYFTFKGTIDNEDLDHLCRVTNCCNPRHLESVSHQENCLRGIGPIADNAQATHCQYGHLFDDLNTAYTKTGRHCRACNRRRMKIRARKGRPPNGIVHCSECGETGHNKLSHRVNTPNKTRLGR